MKKICIVFIFLCLCSCYIQPNKHNVSKTITCQKEIVKENGDVLLYFNHLINFIVVDGKLNRRINVNEYLKNNFEDEPYQEYMDNLMNMYTIKEEQHNAAIKPYYEKDKIIYPHTIKDYTNLDNYTYDEVPKEVRTKDGKAIDFELYWEYINNIGMLDGFTCTLKRDE